MQPQDTNPPAQPPKPQPADYNFILQDNQPKKKILSLPKINLPKPLLVGLSVVIVLLIMATIYGLRSNKSSGNTSSLPDIAARAQEIARVSSLAAGQSHDQQVINLAATVAASLTSDETQLQKYLHLKVGANLTKYQNKATDTQLQTAATNNSLDSTYESYLKRNLLTYQQSLQTAFPKAPAQARTILGQANDNVTQLLASPLLN